MNWRMIKQLRKFLYVLTFWSVTVTCCGGSGKDFWWVIGSQFDLLTTFFFCGNNRKARRSNQVERFVVFFPLQSDLQHHEWWMKSKKSLNISMYWSLCKYCLPCNTSEGGLWDSDWVFVLAIIRPPLHQRGWELKDWELMERSLPIGGEEPPMHARSHKSILHLRAWAFYRVYNA